MGTVHRHHSSQITADPQATPKGQMKKMKKMTNLHHVDTHLVRVDLRVVILHVLLSLFLNQMLDLTLRVLSTRWSQHNLEHTRPLDEEDIIHYHLRLGIYTR